MTVEPDRPEGPLVISNLTGDSVTLSWNAPLDDGGSAVSSYLIEAKDVLDVDIRKTYFRIDSEDTEYVVTGLVNSHIYQFRVYAENKSGRGDALVNKTLVRMKRLSKRPEVPGKPELRILDETNGDVQISWPCCKGSNIEYIIERFDTESNRWKQINRIPVLTECYNVQGLMPDVEYKFRVSAENRAGVSDPSEHTEPVLLSRKMNDIPPYITVPLKDCLTQEDQDAIFYCEFTCSPPPPQIKWFKDGIRLQQGLYITITNDHHSSKLICREICEDDDGATICCQLSNCAGSVSTGAKLNILQLPKIHKSISYNKGLLYDQGDTLSIKFSFSCTTSPNVKWYFNDKICKDDDRTSIQILSNSTQIKILSVTTKDAGRYLLHIINNFGEDKVCVPVSVLGPPDPPPDRPVITILEPGSCSVTWKIPKYDGGSPLTIYILERKRDEEWVEILSTPDTNASVDDLLSDCVYIFRVKAANIFGCGEASEESSPITTAIRTMDSCNKESVSEKYSSVSERRWNEFYASNTNIEPVSPGSENVGQIYSFFCIHMASEEILTDSTFDELVLEHSTSTKNVLYSVTHQAAYAFEVQFYFLEVSDVFALDTIVAARVERVLTPPYETSFENIPFPGTGVVPQPFKSSSRQYSALKDSPATYQVDSKRLFGQEFSSEGMAAGLTAKACPSNISLLNINLVVAEPPILLEETIDINNGDQVKLHPVPFLRLYFTIHVTHLVLLENIVPRPNDFFPSLETRVSYSTEDGDDDFASSCEKLFVFTQCKPALSVLPSVRNVSRSDEPPQTCSEIFPSSPTNIDIENNIQHQKRLSGYNNEPISSNSCSLFQENLVFSSSGEFSDDELEDLLLKYENDYKRSKYDIGLTPTCRIQEVYKEPMNHKEKVQDNIPSWLKQISPQYKFSIEQEENILLQELSSSSSKASSQKTRSVEKLLELANEVELRFDQKAKDIETLEDILSEELTSLQQDLDLVSAIQHSVRNDSFTDEMYSSIEDSNRLMYTKKSTSGETRHVNEKDLIDFTEEIENADEPKLATSAGYPPAVTSHLSNRVITAGCRIRLSCYISSQPEAKVTWLKNGIPIPHKHRYIYSTLWDYGLCCLDIFNAKPSDTGEYTCVAENCFGIVLTQGYLRVAGYKDYSPDEPRFEKSPEDVSITEGKTVVLEWKFSGVPCPQVSWYKNAEKIESGLRIDVFNNHKGCCKLIIRNTTVEDNAIYTCLLENDAGSALSTVLLSISRNMESSTDRVL